MTRRTRRSLEIQQFMLYLIPTHPYNAVVVAAEHFGISRQAASRHMRILVEEGKVLAEGNTKTRRYSLQRTVIKRLTFPLEDLREDKVWREDFKSFFDDAPPNIYELWEYGFTEMLNNAIDHSDGSAVDITLLGTPISSIIVIDDDGIGIFRKIKDACHLDEESLAVLELAKGKLTTDPENHTGEGIFFTSRCFDSFNISSGSIYFNHDERFNDEHWIFENENTEQGTTVFMECHFGTDRILEEVFNEYTSADDDVAFTKTVLPVSLLRHGTENLVSRSQAKRLLARVEKFRTVVLDFKDVETIGQAFADEVFRVFVNRHPDTEIIPIRAGVKIQRMIRRTRPSGQ
ncbi:MAG: DUF4325 domain-containing protein [gamma proteobacterium endosymbiont of Lamellibrachia anaximandri]|nr:DUF4325 domain-containing protein [gamma proteobacterium endosymbiont of Lamellibrachia anaximandri]MBL3618757.1 DUF4325 domain-containing protein [gamma proteobacterium endosymbiont of Lamellibrachia anaximandri]